MQAFLHICARLTLRKTDPTVFNAIIKTKNTSSLNAACDIERCYLIFFPIPCVMKNSALAQCLRWPEMQHAE